MQKAAGSGFAPASVDLATLIWNLPAKVASDTAAALQALKVAGRAGHKASAVWRYAFYKSGRVGLWRRPIVYLFAPFARLRLIFAGFKDPFPCRVVHLSAARHLAATSRGTAAAILPSVRGQFPGEFPLAHRIAGS